MMPKPLRQNNSLICVAILLSALAVRFWYFLAVDHVLDGEENFRLIFALNWPDQHYPMIGPLHLAMLRSLIALTHKPLVAGPLLSIFFGVAVCAMGMLLAYRLLNRDRRATAFAGILLAFQWPLVQYSALAKVEPIFTFFLLACLAILAKELRSKPYVAIAGLSLTAACALRFEAWALIPLLAFEVRRKSRSRDGRWKETILFASCASAFPATWLIGHWLATGDPLFSFHMIAEQGMSWSFAAWFHTFFNALTWPLAILATIGLVFVKPRRFSLFIALFLVLVVVSVSSIGLPPRDIKYFIAPISLAMIPAAGAISLALQSIPIRRQKYAAAAFVICISAVNIDAAIPHIEKQQTPEEFLKIERFFTDLKVSPWSIQSAGEFEKYCGLLQLKLYERNPVWFPPPEKYSAIHRVEYMENQESTCTEGMEIGRFPPWIICKFKSQINNN